MDTQELVRKAYGRRCEGGANAAPKDIQVARLAHSTRAYKLCSHTRVHTTVHQRRQSSESSSFATLCGFGVQAYVDHSIVTVIVENQTALTVWVHPFSPNSTNLALFQRSNPLAYAPAAVGVAGPMVASMDVRQ
eukprot:COSAG02_NODE_16852_length_1051_cov_0.780462_2_plen_133_part_01